MYPIRKKEKPTKRYVVHFIRSYRGTCYVSATSKTEARKKFIEADYDFDTEHESNNGEVIKKIELI